MCKDLLLPNKLPDFVRDVAFSPDGKTLATGSNDGTARLWDVATQQQIGPAMTAAPVNSFLSRLTFGPDGRTLATAGGDGTARLWNVAFPRDLLGSTCAIAGDISLTRAQWAADVPSEPLFHIGDLAWTRVPPCHLHIAYRLPSQVTFQL